MAFARGLVKFPCVAPLLNKYHLMRAGSSLLQEEGMLSTNPLFLTNRDDALSARGQEQVERAARQLAESSQSPTLVKYSLAARCIDTVTIISRELRLGTNSLVPEFTYMDPRGIGAWDMSDQNLTLPALFALDNDEAGVSGTSGRPPSNEDGTPHEVLADQAVRLRQVMSILESLYSGETILLVFPDGSSPALLSSMIAGIPYNQCHELEYSLGEVRLDVTRDSTLSLWNSRENQESYAEALRRGRSNLIALRDAPDTSLNLKDRKTEEERISIEDEMAAKYEAEALVKEKERAVVEAIRQQIREEADAARAQAEVQRQTRTTERASDDNDDSALPSGLAFGGLATVAGLALVFNSPDPSKDKLPQENERKDTVLGSSDLNSSDSASSQSIHTIMNKEEVYSQPREAKEDRIVDTQETRSMMEPTVVRVNGDANSMLDLPVQEVSKETLAAKAMEEYLEKDDGADDWLQSLSEIMNQDEEDDKN